MALSPADHLPPAWRQNLDGLAAEPPDGTATEQLDVRSLTDGLFAGRRYPVFRTPPGDIPVELATLPDATVTPRGFVVADGSLVTDATYLNARWFSGEGSPVIPDLFRQNGLFGFDPVLRRIAFARPAELEAMDRPCFLFNSVAGADNFAHFIFDTMMQVATFREARIADPDLAPLFVVDGFRFMASRALLGWTLGVPLEACAFTRGRFTRVRDLRVPTPHLDFPGGRIAAAAARRMRGLIGTALAPLQPRGAPNIYVTRSDSTRARTGLAEPGIANEAAFDALLDEFGFVRVVASELDGYPYFETFKAARIVLGLHGAGLLNVLLAPDGHLIEIATPGAGGVSLAMTAEAAGIPTRRLLGERTESGDVVVDLAALREAIVAFGG